MKEKISGTNMSCELMAKGKPKDVDTLIKWISKFESDCHYETVSEEYEVENTIIKETIHPFDVKNSIEYTFGTENNVSYPDELDKIIWELGLSVELFGEDFANRIQEHRKYENGKIAVREIGEFEIFDLRLFKTKEAAEIEFDRRFSDKEWDEKYAERNRYYWEYSI